MDRFQELTAFQAVAETGAFAAAARRLNLSTASVSRAVAALEQRVGAALLVRTTRRVHLTEAGERYLDDCRRILAELEEADASAAGSHATARGELSVTAPVLFGALYVTPLIVDYLTAHPQTTVHAMLVDRVVSMQDEGIDVGIRIGDLPDSTLHAVQVGHVRRVVCAAPQLLARVGTPDHPSALARCAVVMASGVSHTKDWRFTDGGKPVSVWIEPRLTVNVNEAAILAARRGFGFTRVLSYQIAAEVAAGELTVVLQRFEPPPLPVHVVFREGRKASAKVRSFVDFCATRLREHPALR